MDVVERTIRAYDKIAAKYSEKTRDPKYLKWEEKYINKLINFISKPEPKILDVGCGDGRHTIIIDRNGGKAIGIDLSDSMLKEANSLYPEGDFRKMDMRKLKFKKDSFDGLWSSGSIYHLPKSSIGEVIKEFRRVLKKGGVLAVNFKLGSGEGMEARPKSYTGGPRYFAYYTEQEMEELFQAQGFTKLESQSYPEEVFGDNILQMWFRLSKSSNSKDYSSFFL